MKTSELTREALNGAVAKCENMVVYITNGGWWSFDSDAFSEYRNDYKDDKLQIFSPSTDWSQGGVIIEREFINTEWLPGVQVWQATCFAQDKYHTQRGSTPLIAAMRCYVASKLGDEVEIPDELLGETA